MSTLSPLDLLDEALTWITRRRTRSLLTALGTLLGVGAFVATLGLTATASAQVSERFDALKATKVTMQPVAGPESGQAGRGGQGGTAFPPDARRRVGQVAGVRSAGVYWRVSSQAVPVRTTADPAPDGATTEPLPVLAAEPGMLEAAGAGTGAGRRYDRGHEQRADRVALVGAVAARRLGLHRVEQRPAIYIDNEPFTVAGVIDDVDRNPDLLLSVVIPTRTATEVWGGPTDTSPLMLINTELGAAQQVGARAPLALRPDDPDALAAEVPPHPRTLRQNVEGDIDTLFLLLAGVSLLVGAIGIANTTLVSVLERVHEIGLRRALGARRRHIAAQFLTESALLGSGGGLLGTCAALAVVVGVSAAQGWGPVLDPRLILAAPLIGTVTGLAAGVYPALKAAGIAPVEALNR